MGTCGLSGWKKDLQIKKQMSLFTFLLLRASLVLLRLSVQTKQRRGLIKNSKHLLSIEVLFKRLLTFRFCGRGQHFEDTHGLVAFVNAHLFHLLDVGQRVHRAAEVGFPCLGVARSALHVFACRYSFHWSPLSAFLITFAEQDMSCSPVWMAHILNRLASFSMAQPCLAACFQGMENIVFSCKKKNHEWKY